MAPLPDPLVTIDQIVSLVRTELTTLARQKPPLLQVPIRDRLLTQLTAVTLNLVLAQDNARAQQDFIVMLQAEIVALQHQPPPPPPPNELPAALVTRSDMGPMGGFRLPEKGE